MPRVIEKVSKKLKNYNNKNNKNIILEKFGFLQLKIKSYIFLRTFIVVRI